MQSGIPSGAKNLCAIVALLAAQPVHLNIVLCDNVRHQKHYPALSFSVAAAVHLLLLATARHSLYATASVLLLLLAIM